MVTVMAAEVGSTVAVTDIGFGNKVDARKHAHDADGYNHGIYEATRYSGYASGGLAVATSNVYGNSVTEVIAQSSSDKNRANCDDHVAQYHHDCGKNGCNDDSRCSKYGCGHGYCTTNVACGNNQVDTRKYVHDADEYSHGVYEATRYSGYAPGGDDAVVSSNFSGNSVTEVIFQCSADMIRANGDYRGAQYQQDYYSNRGNHCTANGYKYGDSNGYKYYGTTCDEDCNHDSASVSRNECRQYYQYGCNDRANDDIWHRSDGNCHDTGALMEYCMDYVRIDGKAPMQCISGCNGHSYGFDINGYNYGYGGCVVNTGDLDIQIDREESGSVQQSIQVYSVPGVEFLRLRGGGPVPESGQSHNEPEALALPPPPPGAGVLEWLERGEELEREERRRIPQKHTISLFDELADQLPEEGERSPTLPPMTVWGQRNLTRVVMCTQCYLDADVANCKVCQCGVVACGTCAARQCRFCGAAFAVWRLAGNHDSPEAGPNGHAADDNSDGLADLSILRAAAQGMAIERVHAADEWLQCSGEDNGTPQVGARGDKGPSACSRCSLPLGMGGIEWRICRCGASTCLACAPENCGDCGQQLTCQDNRRPAECFDLARGEASASPQSRVALGGSALARRPPMDPPVALTPEQAHERRMAMRERKHEANTLRRQRSRVLRRSQQADGRRPRRPPRAHVVIDLVTINITAANTFKEELAHGTALNNVSLVAIQEHGLGDHAHGAFVEWLRLQRAAGVLDSAYFKNTSYGGGTAILSMKGVGLRPLPPLDGEWAGRTSWASLDDHGGIVLVSVYGISGAPLCAQLPLWKAIAERLLALGRLFIMTGDFQVEPSEMQRSGFCALVGAKIVAPGCATNVHTGSQIDYFVVAEGLMDDDTVATGIYGCKFSPHIPVRIRITASATRREVRTLAGPRPLPAFLPPGPQLLGCTVDWQGWQVRAGIHQSNDDTHDLAGKVDTALDQWFGGFEAELFTKFGIFGSPEESAFSGIGLRPRVTMESGQGRFRDVHDDGGIAGHRLTWAAKAAHQIAKLARKLRMNDPDADAHHGEYGRHVLRMRYVDTITRLGHRARAFIQELPKISFTVDGEHDQGAADVPKTCLRAVAATTRSVHGGCPLVWRWANGGAEDQIIKLEALHFDLIKALERRMRKTRSRTLAAARRWARQASLGAAHAATKSKEAALSFSASADKRHRGAASPQRAADDGLIEWAAEWGASEVDVANEVFAAIEAMDVVEHAHPDIVVGPIVAADLRSRSARFKWITAVGTDGARLRHLLFASADAVAALAAILNAIEVLRRWPDAVRQVLANAIPKKAGGSRLIGVATFVYRLWAKVRYSQCQATIESRIERPFLDAAPGRGAARAALAAAFRGEAAVARGGAAATTLADISRFYESVQPADVAQGARAFGLPEAIIQLSLHLYLGPRRIRVGAAVSTATYPSRTVLPGCTWATVHVRLMLIRPVEGFMRNIRQHVEGWMVQVTLSLYVDDWALTTTGDVGGVAFIHPIITRGLVQWVLNYLRMRVAPDKIACVTSSTRLRDTLKPRLAELGVPTALSGDLLGTDYSAGGTIYGRGKGGVASKRWGKHAQRRHRLMWLHRVGGRAREVVHGGIAAGKRYGEEVRGIPPGRARTLRVMYGAVAKIKAVGSSLTARLALGDDDYRDFDPVVKRPNQALMAVLAMIWDCPQRRTDLIASWRYARAQLSDLEPAAAWRKIRGPVGAALLQINRIGAKWERPFNLEIMHHDVNILETPPKQVAVLMTAHARIHTDHQMLGRLSTERGWDHAQVLARYRHGVDWGAVRDVLNDAHGHLTPLERRALAVIAVGGFWPEERRWRAGFCGTGTCSSCFAEIATDGHRLGSCDALRSHLLWHKMAGRIVSDLPAGLGDDLAPLREMALPPMPHGWEPLRGEKIQGSLRKSAAMVFSDGSGIAQDARTRAVSTWAVVRGPADGGLAREVMRGRVDGWFRTVPRAEIRGAIAAVEASGAQTPCAFDCQHVVDVLRNGISKRWTGSAAFNADLWRRAKRALDGGAGPIMVIKTKAHRSRAAAEVDVDDPLIHWIGNDAADHHAKQLARAEHAADHKLAAMQASRNIVLPEMRRIAASAAWALRQLPEVKKDPRRQKAFWRRGGSGQCGDHDLRPAPGGKLQCTHCKLFTRTRTSFMCLRAKPCRGDIASRAHQTHVLDWTAGVTWCRTCGAYAARLPRRLAAPCAGGPSSEAQANVRRRLRCGLPPTTAKYVVDIAHDHRHEAPRAASSDAGHAGRAGGRRSAPPAPPHLDHHHSHGHDDKDAVDAGGRGDGMPVRTRDVDTDAMNLREVDGGSGILFGLGATDGNADETSGTNHLHGATIGAVIPVACPPAGGHGQHAKNVDAADAAVEAALSHDDSRTTRDAEANGAFSGAVPSPPRCRLRGKQSAGNAHRAGAPPPSGPDMRDQQTGDAASVDARQLTRWCSGGSATGWAARSGHPLPAPAGCSLCSRPTRATCRGCERPTCFGCLKERRSCHVATTVWDGDNYG